MCETFFRDWLYVGSPMVMTALAKMTRRKRNPGDLPLTDLSMRCLGWCQEEQVELQMRLKYNLSLAPLLAGGLDARVERMPAGIASTLSTQALKPAKGCSVACPGTRRCLRREHGRDVDYSYMLDRKAMNFSNRTAVVLATG